MPAQPIPENQPAANPPARRPRPARIAWLLVLIACFALAFAQLWPARLDREDRATVTLELAAFMLQTFTFHIGVALALLAARALFARKLRLALATLPPLAWSLGPAALSLIPKTPPPAGGETIRVVSCNLLAFNHEMDPIVAEMKASGADLIFFQEYTPRWHQALAGALGQIYPHVCAAPAEGCFGSAIYSRLPLLSGARQDFHVGAYELPQLQTAILLEGREVALYDVHIYPPGRISSYREQRAGFRALLERLAEERRPTIVCGDFNFTNNSPLGQTMRQAGWTDAHDLAGLGRGSSWPVIGPWRYVPGVRIDHVFLSRELTATRSATGVGIGSDHRPVTATVGFRAATPQ